MDKLNRRRYGKAVVIEAAAVVATRLSRQISAASRKGKADEKVMRDLGCVVLTAKAAAYIPIEETKDFLTYLSLL